MVRPTNQRKKPLNLRSLDFTPPTRRRRSQAQETSPADSKVRSKPFEGSLVPVGSGLQRGMFRPPSLPWTKKWEPRVPATPHRWSPGIVDRMKGRLQIGTQ